VATILTGAWRVLASRRVALAAGLGHSLGDDAQGPLVSASHGHAIVIDELAWVEHDPSQ
jgi:hypothetical protein